MSVSNQSRFDTIKPNHVVGMVGGKCHATNITKGNVYIMYLNKDDSQEKWFEPTYMQNDGGDQFIDEITFECNMKPIPPIGKEGADTQCPASEDGPGLCDTWTPAPTTKAPVTPEPEPKTPNPETPGKDSKTVDNGNGSAVTTILSFVSLFICLCFSILL
ncbi:hypothetical protein KUTeg_020133 [Tegillarca granosa]|uniref:Uncharacterized protein n=1 Tax=Tegillarca granosa TaxID=220873 RepID=A0ABQ9E6X5_TEGGR|nr:hypothetical protein KUTeg_020133 [Tegillarca granosa]